ncbi:GNAT family N-acetyltransferase [Halomonas sp. GT]|uniref:GNAT family N-acetyltransferase n=1 Tax=Halomonas sp. GT TaxID=1971364 RepID=UPI003FA5886E
MAHICQMWVTPAVRGEGIAKALLSEIRTWALDKECECLALDVAPCCRKYFLKKLRRKKERSKQTL